MGKHNLVLWLDYTEEATTYHTLDMSMCGAVRYRRTFSYDDCNLLQSEFWYDPQALDTAHWLCDSFADFIAPVSFVLLSYMDEMALNATRRNRARKEATLKELKVDARMFIEAKSAEIKSWLDNDVFDLVDICHGQMDGCLPLNGIEMVSSRSARQDGCFADFKTARRMLSRRTAQRRPDQVCDFFARMHCPMVGPSATLTSRLRSFRGKVMHQTVMWSVNCLQKQASRGT